MSRTLRRAADYLKEHDFVIQPRAYGLNYEFDFQLSGNMPSAEWLGKRFATSGLRHPESAKATLQSLTLQLTNYENLRLIKIEPRKGDDQRIFVYANLHNDCERLLQSEELELEAERGLEKASSLVESMLED